MKFGKKVLSFALHQKKVLLEQNQEVQIKNTIR